MIEKKEKKNILDEGIEQLESEPTSRTTKWRTTIWNRTQRNTMRVRERESSVESSLSLSSESEAHTHRSWEWTSGRVNLKGCVYFFHVSILFFLVVFLIWLFYFSFFLILAWVEEGKGKWRLCPCFLLRCYSPSHVMGGTLWVLMYLCERLWSKRRLGTCRVVPTHVNVLMTVFEKPSIRIKVLFPRAELSIDTFGVLCLTVTTVIKYCSTSYGRSSLYLWFFFSILSVILKPCFITEKTNNYWYLSHIKK